MVKLFRLSELKRKGSIPSWNLKCHILGNGKTLTDALLRSVSEHQVIVCNYFYTHPLSGLIHNPIYCIGDPLIGDDSDNQIRLLMDTNSLIHHPVFVMPSEIAFKFKQSTSSGSLNLGQKVKILHSPFTDFNADRPTYDFRLDIGIQPYQNILAFMLQIAIYLGFRDIVLHGFGHGCFFIQRPGDLPLNFNSETKGHYFRGHSHIIPKKPYIFDTEDHLRIAYTMWHQYKRLKHMAELQGVRIRNATPDSYLDVFETVTAGDALSQP